MSNTDMNFDPRRGLWIPQSVPPKAQGFPPHLDIPKESKGPQHIHGTSPDRGAFAGDSYWQTPPKPQSMPTPPAPSWPPESGYTTKGG